MEVSESAYCGDINYRSLIPNEMVALSEPLPSIPLATMPREYLAEEMILWGHGGAYRTYCGRSSNAEAI